MAAREKGGDPKTNPALRMAIEKAKAANMPNDNIERAIKKGVGGLEGAKMEFFSYEAYAPGGAALIIEGITDNKNRTLSEIKHILSAYGGKFAGPGSVSYLFQKRGVINVSSEENNLDKGDLELLAIEAGAEDLKWRDNTLEIYTKIEDLEKIKGALKTKNISVESSSLEWVAETEIEMGDEKTKGQLTKLLDALSEHEDVNEIYSNLKS